jgi:hypothetical protein
MNWDKKRLRFGVWAIAITAGLVVLISVLMRRPSGAQAVNDRATDRDSGGALFSGVARNAVARAVEGALRSVEAGPRDGDAIARAREEIRRDFTALWGRRRFINSKDVEVQMFDRVLADPAARREAVAIVSDLDYAEEAYGEDQAVVRVYALKMMRRAAAQGDSELIEQALEPLSKTLNSSDGLRKGQDEDYASLVASYILALGDGAVLDDPGKFMASIGVSPKIALALDKGIYDSGITRRVPTAELREILGPYAMAPDNSHK